MNPQDAPVDQVSPYAYDSKNQKPTSFWKVAAVVLSVLLILTWAVATVFEIALLKSLAALILAVFAVAIGLLLVALL